MSGVASANSAATSARRNRRAAGPSVAERPPDRSARSIAQPTSCESRARDRRAKIRTPLPTASAAEPAEQRRRQPDLVDARDVVGAVGRDELERQRGDTGADAAAPAVSTPLSTTRCCSSRPREAPSALRMASSRLRASARATSRLMALAHAMRSTQPTAASDDEQRGADVADDACLQIQQAPRRLLVLIGRLPDRETAARSWRAACRAPPRATRPARGAPAPW